MPSTATMTQQNTSAASRSEKNPVLFFAPAKCQYVIIAAAATFVISIIIPPRGMLKPDEAAPDWLEKNPATSGNKGKKE
eukprot:CCRYP_017268-RA/>CCRYP_017268-RA protein AED:0.39 eAED:0.61 QI:220/0/0.5/1/0/0/2/0/78